MTEPDLAALRLSRDAEGGRPATRRRWRRTLIPGLFAVSIVAGGLGWVWYLRQAPVAVSQATVVTAYPYQAFAVLTSTGYVVAQRKAAVASKATGRLDWLGVAEGSRVRRGEVIARLESSDVEAARDQAAAGLKVARANLEQSRVESGEARRNLGRSADLVRQQFVSAAVHEQALARVERADAGVRSLAAAVAVAQANLRAAEVAVEQTRIRAPFDGIVLTKSANVGDVVTPFSSSLDAKGAVVTMADMTTLEVEADVSESNLSRVRLEQPVEIQLDALPDMRFRGFVSRMVPTVDRAKATVMTKIRFASIDPRVLPEMSAKATFLSQEVSEDQRKPRTAVTPAAVVKRDGLDVVFVVADGVARRREVRLGGRLGDHVEVLTGLAPGDRVVAPPGEALADGTRVKAAAK
ncbi:MAG: efflux RND transporter periplasmic adaptor subunit [Betaproteobacteria bacterium]